MDVAVVAASPRGDPDPEAGHRLDWLAAALADRGHAVTRFGPVWWPDRNSNVDMDATAFQALTADPTAPPRRLAVRLPAALRKADPDFIQTNHSAPIVVLTAATAATAMGVPLAVDWFDTPANERWEDRLRRRAVLAPDLVITPSRLVQTALRELDRDPSGLSVIPSPIDMELLRAVEPEPLADLVYSRRLDAAANLENLLLSLAEFRELDWELAVIGDGPARDEYESQAAALRIADRVRFLGDQPLERRLGVFRGAHAYAHTARETPFARELLRALACGCVGIVEYHADSAAHELIEHRDRGLGVTDEEALAGAIRAASELERSTIDDTFAEFDVDPVLDRYLGAIAKAGAPE